MYKITNVEVLEEYRLNLTFSNGVKGTVDLSHLVGSGVFTLWSDYSKFRKVRIADTGELLWADQVDLCPDALYLQATGEPPENVFPALKHEMAYA